VTGGRRRAGRGASVRRGAAERSGKRCPRARPLGSPGNSPRAPGGGESGRPAGWRVTGLRGSAREDPSGNHEARAAAGDPSPHPGPRRPIFRPAARGCQRPDPSELARAAGPAARRASSRARPGSRRRRPQCPRSRRGGPARCTRPRRLCLADSSRRARVPCEPPRPGLGRRSPRTLLTAGAGRGAVRSRAARERAPRGAGLWAVGAGGSQVAGAEPEGPGAPRAVPGGVLDPGRGKIGAGGCPCGVSGPGLAAGKSLREWKGPGRECGSSGKLGCRYPLHGEVQKTGCWGGLPEAIGRCKRERVRSRPRRNRAVQPLSAGHSNLEKSRYWSVSLILESLETGSVKEQKKTDSNRREVATTGAGSQRSPAQPRQLSLGAGRAS
jgi:hypothetical protein